MSLNSSLICIVDDDRNLLAVTRQLLEAAGYRVAAFASGEAFCRECHALDIGCVLLDMKMPGWDGLCAQRHLRQHGFDAPIIFLSGRADIPHCVEALKDGAVDFLTKPVRGRELTGAIEEALRKHAETAAERLLRRQVKANLARLTQRERDVLQHVVAGKPNKLIASDLAIVEKTVKVHRRRIMEKLEAGSVAELVRRVLAVPDWQTDPRGTASLPSLPSSAGEVSPPGEPPGHCPKVQ